MHQEGNNNHDMEASRSDRMQDDVQQVPHTQMMYRPTRSLVHPTHFSQLSGSNRSTLLQQITSDHIKNQQVRLRENLEDFWKKQMQEVNDTSKFPKPQLPIERIKKLISADQDVRMISRKTIFGFAKACEMFIMDLTIQAWNIAEDDRRKKLQKCDIFSAIERNPLFDFATSIMGPSYVPHETVGSYLRRIVVDQHVTQGLHILEKLQQNRNQVENQHGVVDHGLFVQQQHQQLDKEHHQPMDHKFYLQQIEQHLEQDENDKEVEMDELEQMQQELEKELQQSSKGS